MTREYEGVYVFDTDGKRYFDGLSSLFCAQIGYSFGEEMASVASQQLSTMVGKIFLGLIFMIVVPLVVSALLLGVYELGVGQGMGRVFAKTLGGTVLASTAAVFIGITLVYLIRPGEGANLPTPEESPQYQSIRESAEAAKPLHQTLIELLPRNPLFSATRALEGEIIALMVACLILGAAMSARGVRDKVAVTLVPLLEQQVHRRRGLW